MRNRKPKPRPPEGSALTGREQEVMRYVCKGFTSPQIAERMGITLYTVNDHLKNALSRLGACTRAEAAYRAARQGFEA